MLDGSRSAVLEDSKHRRVLQEYVSLEVLDAVRCGVLAQSVDEVGTQTAVPVVVDIAERDYPRVRSLRQLCDHGERTMK